MLPNRLKQGPCTNLVAYAERSSIYWLLPILPSPSGTPGTTGTFTGIEPDSYTLKVTATSEEETKQIDMRLDVPASREECTVNLINRGIEISGSNATVSFAGVGPVTSYSCRFAGGSFYRCKFSKW